MKVLLVDTMSQLYRAHFAMRGSLSANGVNTSGIFGIMKDLAVTFSTHQFDAVAFALDGEPVRRKSLYPPYKANRYGSSDKDEVYNSVPYLIKLLKAAGIPILHHPDLEADDLVSVAAHQLSKEGYEVYLYSGDDDYLQLLSLSRVKIIRGNDIPLITENYVREKYNVGSAQLPLFRAICKDSSDNIQGIPRFNRQSAEEASRYLEPSHLMKNLDRILAARSIPPAHVEKLYQNREIVYRNFFLMKLPAAVDKLFYSPRNANLVEYFEICNQLMVGDLRHAFMAVTPTSDDALFPLYRQPYAKEQSP